MSRKTFARWLLAEVVIAAVLAIANVLLSGARGPVVDPSSGPRPVSSAQSPSLASAPTHALPRGAATSGDLDAAREAVAPLTVRVRDLRGRGIAGAEVTVRAGRREDPIARGATDRAGSFEVAEAPLAGLSAAAQRRGYVPSGWSTVKATRAHGLLIDLTLTEGVPVAGLVLAAEDGRSLEGAQVHARLTWGESSEITEHLESVETDADGRFLLSGAPPSRPVTILAEADGRIPSRLVLRTPESTDPVVLRLSRGGTVGGRVYAPDGTPCREGEAWITEVGSVRRIQAARIREDGTFELTGVPVIPEGIRLWAKGCGSAPTTTAALPAATAHGIDVRQDVHLVMPHILQVTFLASDGTTPSSPTSFVVEVASGGQDIFPEAARVVRTVTGPIAAVDLGAETSWSRDQPPALRVVALVGGREYAEADAALVPGGSSTILRGQRARPLAGAVFSETGRPVPKVRVVWTSARLGDGEGGRHESTTDDAGEFRFAALPGPGSLRCHGGADWLDANVEDVAPGSSPLRIELRRAARVQGRLVDPWGAPRPWVLLGLTDPANESFAGHVFHQTGTNADGRFAFDRIDPRRWQVVWVRRPSAEDIPVVDFEVAAGAALDVEWVLRAR